MTDPQYIERDISWLSFNHRVLQEANDPSVPLYERLKFLAIYSSNLDEFFRVRVASLRSFKELKKKTRKKITEVKPKRALKAIQAIVDAQQQEFGKIFRESIIPALAKEKIFLIDHKRFNVKGKAFAREYFQTQITPFIKPFPLIKGKEAPFLKNNRLYFIVDFKAASNVSQIIEIPSKDLNRFVALPKTRVGYPITFIDDIIRFNLPAFFKGKAIKGIYALKVSRDAELYIDDEYDGDLIDKLRKSLSKRNIGLPTRFLYDAAIPEDLMASIKEVFELSNDDLIPGARYHNFNDFFGFPDPTDNPALHDEKLPPLPHPQLDQYKNIFKALQQKDFMLHFPYQSYEYVPRFILQAADDKKVKSIKITLYRVAAHSEVTKALMYAIGKGKKVTVFIEAKARFDEESNLFWGEALAKAGAKVLYSFPGIKVHTKLLLITRKEGKKDRNYAYLGTGNFNEKTAKLYCDHALLTADPRVADEVVQVFDIITERKLILPKLKHLFMSPFTLRRNFTKLIDKEIKQAKAGKEAYMILKMNSLEDKEMINKLYEASQAGVDIQMIVRGICCLVPGVPGLSENIRITSIVDRFLEHARVYIFGNKGKEIMYTASADWMTRNLDQRIEVAMPIYDKEVYQELRYIIDLQLSDNQKARIINEQQDNTYKIREEDEIIVRAQRKVYSFCEDKIKEV